MTAGVVSARPGSSGPAVARAALGSGGPSRQLHPGPITPDPRQGPGSGEEAASEGGAECADNHPADAFGAGDDAPLYSPPASARQPLGLATSNARRAALTERTASRMTPSARRSAPPVADGYQVLPLLNNPPGSGDVGHVSSGPNGTRLRYSWLE